jgi:hypothetical protein
MAYQWPGGYFSVSDAAISSTSSLNFAHYVSPVTSSYSSSMMIWAGVAVDLLDEAQGQNNNE